MAISLKNIQQYRYTIPVIFIMLGIAILLAIISISSVNNKPAPLAPSPKAVYKSPVAQPIKWDQAKLQMTKDEVISKFGNPANIEIIDSQEILIYLDNPNRPNFQHRITLKDNKVIKIFRIIDSEIEDINPNSFTQLYGEPEVIREYINPEIKALNGYKINNNEYLVVEFTPTISIVSNLTIMTQEEYEKFKQENSKMTELEGIGEPGV